MSGVRQDGALLHCKGVVAFGDAGYRSVAKRGQLDPSSDWAQMLAKAEQLELDPHHSWISMTLAASAASRYSHGVPKAALRKVAALVLQQEVVHMSDEVTYQVVVNDEEQYSIWPTFKESVPAGWRSVGFEGGKQACLDRIKEIWVDMRPLSVREA